jgi:hypothetical protein
MAQNNNQPNFAKIALYIGGGYLLYKLVTGLSKNIIGHADTGTSVESAACDKIWNNTTLSRSKTAYYADADEIYTAIIGSGLFVQFYEDDPKIAAVLMRAGKDADVAALICAFGYRKSSTLAPAEPLTAYITAYLDSDKVKEVNDYYAYKGITYRW